MPLKPAIARDSTGLLGICVNGRSGWGGSDKRQFQGVLIERVVACCVADSLQNDGAFGVAASRCLRVSYPTFNEGWHRRSVVVLEVDGGCTVTSIVR